MEVSSIQWCPLIYRVCIFCCVLKNCFVMINHSMYIMQTIPAAHLKGRGQIWDLKDGKYSPQWDCTDNVQLAFVTGGMRFEQSDNSLHVPVCGLYQVSSQITFKNNDPQPHNYVHTLKINRNCDASSNRPYSRSTYTMIGPWPLDESNIEARSSTFASDIVKICTGGSIHVDIPTELNSCCPRGDDSMTFLAAHLVQEVACD